MNIIDKLETSLIPSPCVLTIGNFDGLHLGHQAVLDTVKTIAKLHDIQSGVITFVNQPAQVLYPHKKIVQICTLKHKIKLIEKHGIDQLILLQFTKELSEKTAEEFLQEMRQKIPFTHLILGYDATLGKDRQGDRKQIEVMSKVLGFEVQYLEPLTLHHQPISSTRIRGSIQQGDFKQASTLLGREYSIYSTVIPGLKMGRTIGFPTANLNVAALCLPPYGVYAVRVKIDGKILHGVANLGFAPTIRQDKDPTLEIYLFDTSLHLYDEAIEVFFQAYIRPEKKFDSIPELQKQIQDDIAWAKEVF